MIFFINETVYAFQSLDNNEINLENHKITPFIENIAPPIISSNVILNKANGNHSFEKSVTFAINGIAVGVVGFLKPESRILEDIEYIDEVIAITEEVQRLKKSGVSIVIAIGYSDTAKITQIAQEVEGLDLVIAGHRNTFFSNVNKDNFDTVVAAQSTGKEVPIIPSHAYNKYLGQVKLSFVEDGEGIFSWENIPILLDNTVVQDVEALQIINKHKNALMRNSEEVIGVTSVVLDGDTCGSAECNFGNLIADAMMYTHAIKFEGDNWTDAPIAVIPAGSILGSIAPEIRPANITIGDLTSVVPAERNMVTVTTNGAILLQLLEQSVVDYNPEASNDGFLQYSGIRVVYDMSQEPGSRIVSVVARCSSCFVPEFYAIDDWRTYTILMPSDLAQGSYGYEFLADLERVDLAYDEATCVSEYLGLRSPVYPEVANRITLLNVGSIAEIEITTPETVTESLPEADSAIVLSSTFTVLVTLLMFMIVMY